MTGVCECEMTGFVHGEDLRLRCTDCGGLAWEDAKPLELDDEAIEAIEEARAEADSNDEPAPFGYRH